MSHANQFGLLRERRFAPFFWTQFLGAANDNVFKFAFTVLATYDAAHWGGLPATAAGPVIGALFILPFVLFSATAGQLADKLEKSRLIRLVKTLEIGIAALIAAGFAWRLPTCLFAGVFLMGLHSTVFGPVKYAYLPQHLRTEELTGGNGMVEMGTFVAILLGTLLGGTLIGIPESGADYVAFASLALAVAGRIASGFVPPSAPSEPELVIRWNPFAETWRNLRIARQTRSVFLSLLGISWLWFFGAVFLTSFTGFAKQVLGGDEHVVTLLLAVFSIGIGIGSLACERLSGPKVEIGLVPFGSIGMSAFAIDLYFASRAMQPTGLVGVGAFLGVGANWRVLADLFLLALFGGFYSVPLYALIQTRSEPSHRARIIAANNILNAVFMVASSIMAAGLLMAGCSLPQLFLVTAILNALVAAYIYTLVPEFLMRFLCWLLVHTLYRVREEGLEHIPQEGPAVLVCNHVSYVDALVIMAASPRPVRFVMDHRIFRVPILSFVFRTSRAIPIASSREDPAVLERAFDEVARALSDGDLVGIFPEGSLTGDGEIQRFRPGVKEIVARTPVPVVPLALKGLWGSYFSRKAGRAMTVPRGIFSRIGLAAEAPVPAAAVTPELLQARVLALRGEER